MQSTAAEGVIEQSVRRTVAARLQSMSSERTHSKPPTTLIGSTLGRSIVVRAPLVALPSRNIVVSIDTSVGIHHAESSRAKALWSASTQSPTTYIDVARATVLWRTLIRVVGSASSGQRPQTSKKTKVGRFLGGGQQRKGGG